jgi:hypothetical protein
MRREGTALWLLLPNLQASSGPTQVYVNRNFMSSDLGYQSQLLAFKGLTPD